jgi:hypothetical protein
VRGNASLYNDPTPESRDNANKTTVDDENL